MKFLITKESNGQTMYALDYRPENLYRKFRWTTVSAQAREFEDGEVSTVDLFYFTKIPLKGKEPGRKYYWTSWTKTADGRIGEYFVSSMTTDKPLPYYKFTPVEAIEATIRNRKSCIAEVQAQIVQLEGLLRKYHGVTDIDSEEYSHI
jgi:hypothetical protein